MPCLVFFVPRGQRKLGTYLLETLFVVVALALVSPFVSAPGGSVVTLATLLLLAQSQHTLRFGSRGLAAAGLWAIAGLFIGLASMESVWLPWLMLCPWFAPPGFYRSPAKLLLLPGTVPLLAMHPVARWVILGAAGFEVWSLLRPRPSPRCKTPDAPRPAVAGESLARTALALLLVFPFLASSLSGWMRSPLLPPPGVMSQRVAANAFKLRLLGQARDIELMLYTPSGDGRHHTLPVCMRYRGIRLQPVRDEPSVMTDGKRWMKEFFLQGGQLVSDYRAYLRRTMWPWSSAGVHVIASMPTNAMGATAFAQNVDRLARDLHALGPPVRGPAGSPRALASDPRNANWNGNRIGVRFPRQDTDVKHED